jgi:hypothetical protein
LLFYSVSGNANSMIIADYPAVSKVHQTVIYFTTMYDSGLVCWRLEKLFETV